jgi:hypothetical protein
MGRNRPSELPLNPNLRDCDPDGFISVADLRRIFRWSRGKVDHLSRRGKLRKYHFGGNVRFRVQNALDIIEDATGERPDPWATMGVDMRRKNKEVNSFESALGVENHDKA